MAQDYSEYSPEALAEECGGLHQSIGAAIGAFSKIEHALAEAFGICLGIKTPPAKAVFFAVGGFAARARILLAAISTFAPQDPAEAARAAVFKETCKLASSWSETRNRVAHQQFAVCVLAGRIVSGVVIPNLSSGDEALAELDNKMLTRQAIDESTANFASLATIISQACSEREEVALQKLLAQSREFPGRPFRGEAGLLSLTAELLRQQQGPQA